jgi:hypothetical protein
MPDPGDTAAGDTKTVGNWNGAPGGTTTSNNGSTPSSNSTSNNGSTSSQTSAPGKTDSEASKSSPSTPSTKESSPAPSQTAPATKSSSSATNTTTVSKSTPAPGPTNYTPTTATNSVTVTDPSRSIPSTPGAPGKTDLYGGSMPSLNQVPNGTTAAQQATNLANNVTPDYQRSLTDAVSGVPGPQVPTADRSIASLVSDPTNIAPSTETMASLRSAIGVGAPPVTKFADRVPQGLPSTPPAAPPTQSYAPSQYSGYGVPDAPETQLANMQGLVNTGAITPTPVGDPISGGTLVAGDPRVGMPPGSFQSSVDGPPEYETATNVPDLGLPGDPWSPMAPATPAAPASPMAPSQDASQPGNLAQLGNRANYTYDQARDGFKDLPSKLYDAIVGGNITAGQDLHGLQQARGGGGGIDPFPTNQEPLDVATLQQFMQQLKRRGVSGNQQLQLIMSTFV